MNPARKILTICLVQEPDRLLLGMKKRGFGTGRFNGFGGKLQSGESIVEAAIRELEEEAGIRALDLEEAGVLDFSFSGKEEIMEVHIFRVKSFSGEISESEEMRPQWFNLKEIPYDSMWADDIHWLPLFLDNKKFRGRFLFDKNDQVLEKEIKVI